MIWMIFIYFFKIIDQPVTLAKDPHNMASSMPSISENGVSSSLEEENESIDAHIKSHHDTEFIQDMENKFHRLKDFLQTLGPNKNSQIPKELLQNFQRDPDQFREIDSTFILKEAGKRIDKMRKARKLKKNWSCHDMKVLIWVICKYSEQQSISMSEVQSHDEFWKFVSSVIPGTTPESCLFKWLSERRYKITLHSWKTEQQKLLMDLQKKYASAKNKWKLISEELYLENQDKDKIFRHPKQCREHYASFLDPNIVKGPWSKNEDNILLTHIALNSGEKKWCKLTRVLQGRTENAIKNRFQLLFSKLKKKKQNKSKSEYEIIVEYLKESDPQFEIKKQRAQAVKNAEQEKSSVQKVENKTTETIKSVQSMSVIPSGGLILQQPSARVIVPIVLKHRSDFRPFCEREERGKEQKEILGRLGEGKDKEEEKGEEK